MEKVTSLNMRLHCVTSTTQIYIYDPDSTIQSHGKKVGVNFVFEKVMSEQKFQSVSPVQNLTARTESLFIVKQVYVDISPAL